MDRMRRRSFLGSSMGLLAAGAGVPLILPPRAWGRATVNEQITIGMIGMGIRARNLMKGARWLESDRIRILAVCDVDTTRREHRRAMVDEAYGNHDCASYNDYRDLLARDDIDAVCIATPDHWHAIQIIDACRAGKDIYCEKPLTLTLHEGRACIDAVRTHDRVFQTGSQQRSEYAHRFVQACEIVRSGRLGRIVQVHVGVGDPARWCDLDAEDPEAGLDWDRWLGPAPMRPYHSELSPRGVHNHYPRWRAYREYSGGYFTDMGAHHYDIAQWGLGMDDSGPVRVELPEKPLRSIMRGARLVYADGTVVTHGGPSGTTFIGTDGMLHVDRGRIVSVPEGMLDEPLDEAHRLPRHASHLDNWIDCVHARTRPICDVEVGARSIACCQLVNLAYWHDRGFSWDPDGWRLTDADNSLQDYRRREGYPLPMP